MKTKKLFQTATVCFALLFLTPFSFSYVQSQEPDDYPGFDWSLVYPDGIDDQDVWDGGNVGEATITCSLGTWGRCFRLRWFWADSDSFLGEFKCLYTGNPEHYCHHLYLKFANLIYVPNWLGLEE